MKAFLSLIPLFVLSAAAAEPISIEEFKKLNEWQQQEVIEHAPPESKEMLKKVARHQHLLNNYDGEEGFKWMKEQAIAYARGFFYVQHIFDTQIDLRARYIATVLEANEKSGMSQEKQGEVELALRGGNDSLLKRYTIARSFLVKMAPTPEALALAKRAEDLDNEVTKKFALDGMTRKKPPVTREQSDAVDKQIDQIFEEMKKLPALPPEQLKKEYDSFPDEDIPG